MCVGQRGWLHGAAPSANRERQVVGHWWKVQQREEAVDVLRRGQQSNGRGKLAGKSLSD